MAEDKREQILARLFVVLQSLVEDKPERAKRNQINIPEGQRPGIVLLDGDETIRLGDPSGPIAKRPANAPVIVALKPEIYILLGAKSENIGTDLNAWRAKIIKAVLADSPLVALCHDGVIRYDGFSTGFAAGRSMEGEAGVSLTFDYALSPSKL